MPLNPKSRLFKVRQWKKKGALADRISLALGESFDADRVSTTLGAVPETLTATDSLVASAALEAENCQCGNRCETRWVETETGALSITVDRSWRR